MHTVHKCLHISKVLEHFGVQLAQTAQCLSEDQVRPGHLRANEDAITCDGDHLFADQEPGAGRFESRHDKVHELGHVLSLVLVQFLFLQCFGVRRSKCELSPFSLYRQRTWP